MITIFVSLNTNDIKKFIISKTHKKCINLLIGNLPRSSGFGVKANFLSSLTCILNNLIAGRI